MAAPDTKPTIPFASPSAFRAWLAKNHAQSAGIWLHFMKKDSGKKSITYAQALDEALCFGWIDGHVKKFDADSWIQKFTPRRPKTSKWSKRNTQYAERLIAEKKMMPAGLLEMETAKKDGRWQQAYDSPSNATVPEDFLKELKKDKAAFAFFSTLNKANLYAIIYRLQTAKKPETRERRMKLILEMLSNGKKFH